MTQKVHFKAKSGADTSGEIVVPDKPGKLPAVVLIQEWWGVNDHIRSVVKRFADAGFVVLAPDLYHGKTTKDAGEAASLMNALDRERALDEIGGAIGFLAKHERSNGKVGIVGFCMGGAYSFGAAARFPELACAVPFYGLNPADDLTKIRVPVQTHVAKRDQWVTPASAEKAKQTIDAHGPAMEVHVYEADHAFFNDTRPEVYAPEAAQLAFSRAVDFLHKNLG